MMKRVQSFFFKEDTENIRLEFASAIDPEYSLM